MKYRKGYKYQLAADEVFETRITPPQGIDTEFISLSVNGVLKVKQGYAWDGPSGPTWDRKENMRGSLAHDALYQLMRNELLPGRWRPDADAYMCQCCIEDGMRKYWAKLYQRELGKFAGFAADPRNVKKIYEV
jgi:hypothetical protein